MHRLWGDGMTLWEAYRLANRRRAALDVQADGERLHVLPRRRKGNVEVWVPDAHSDGEFARCYEPDQAKALQVDRLS